MSGHRTRALVFGCLLPALAAVAGQSAEQASMPVQRAAEAISEDYIRGVVREISSDAYEGRGPGSQGDRKAREYLAAQLASLGLQPGAADGGWQQRFELVSLDARQPPAWTFEHQGRQLALKQWEQFVARSGVQAPRAEIADAEVVFVGYGIQAPEFEWDDYKGADLRGKVLLMMNNDPDWDPQLFGGVARLWYGRWDYKFLSAARQGAAAAIIIHTSASAGYPYQVVQTSNTGPQFELPAADEPRSQVKAWVSEDAARDLVALAGRDLDALREQARRRDFRPVSLGVRTSLALDVAMQRVETANVLGLIPGSDPELRDEVVVYSAHHDHLGIGKPDASGDVIYNGARDNAAGVAQVLAIARAFKALPQAPRRSILVALVGAEEQGLLGSQWYTRHPTFAPGRIAAVLNYDGGNIWGPTTDAPILGLGKSSLDDLVTPVAAAQGRSVTGDEFPDRGYYYRSDQFSFARIGVPGLFSGAGTQVIGRPEGWGREQQNAYNEVSYHQPSDEYSEDWNLAGMLQDTLLGYWVGLAVANAEAMPAWTAGDEFEPARLRALEALAGEE